jgi:hypothetical protein
MNRGGHTCRILAGAAAVVPAAFCTGFGLWFAPGWANGWPLGLPRNVVWPAGLAVVAASAVALVGLGVGLAAREEQDVPRPAWLRRCLVDTCLAAVVAGAIVYAMFRPQALALWP